MFVSRYTKATPSISYSENPHQGRNTNSKNSAVKSNDKEKLDSERKRKVSDTSSKDAKEQMKKTVMSASLSESLQTFNHNIPSHDEDKIDNSDQYEPDKETDTREMKLKQSPMKTLQTPEVKSPEKLGKVTEKLRLEIKIERKKSPKVVEKPKVNIFLEDSDEVDEFESIAITEVKSKWSSPEVVQDEKNFPTIVPAPVSEPKRSQLGAPIVIESPESSLMTVEKSPTPSPPPPPSKVRNVCSFLSDIASGNIFSGLGLGSGLYDEANRTAGGLNLDDYKVELNKKLPEVKMLEDSIKMEIESIMEPDTTGDKILDRLTVSKPLSDSDSESEDSDSDTSSSSDSDSDDTTSESEESSEDSSDDEVPSFTRGFGRFDASSMPMVTQIKTTQPPTTQTTQSVTVASRFQPQQSIIKPPGLMTNVPKPSLYTPPVVQSLSSITTPFSIGVGAMPFPIPFKIYSLRDTNNLEHMYPATQQTISAVVSTQTAEKEKKSAEKASVKRDKDRKRSRSRSHSRDREKKRAKDERRKSPLRRRSPSPVKKRHLDDRNRPTEERKDSRRQDPSPRHSSRTSHGSR